MSDPTTETKTLEFELKSLDELGHWTGYANVTGIRDSGGDIVHPGAFARTVKARGGKFPVMAFHDPTRDIGVAVVKEDEKGLEVADGILNLDTADGRDAYAKLKFYRDHGLKAEMSIGYQTMPGKVDWTEDPKLGSTRNLREVKLLEISLLPPGYAMNDRSTVRTVKTIEAPATATLEPLVVKVSSLADRVAALEARLATQPAPSTDSPAEHSVADPGKADDSLTHSSTADDAEGLKALSSQLTELREVLRGPAANPERSGRVGHRDQGGARAS